MSKFKVGDEVTLDPSIMEPYYGWGSVKHGDIGIVTPTTERDRVRVNFPTQSGWSARPHELVLVNFSLENE